MTTLDAQPGRRRQTTLVGTDHGTRILGIVLINGLLAVTLTLIYLFIFLGILLVFDSKVRNEAHFLATVAVAVLVVPMRQRFVSLSNYLLQRQWQDYDGLLREFTDLLSRTIDANAIAGLMVDDLCNRLRLRGAMLWILTPPEDIVFIALGKYPDSARSELLVDGVAVGLVRTARGYLVLDPDRDSAWAEPFLSQGLRILFPLHVGRRMIGMYGCGEPMTSQHYPRHVVNLILTLTPAVAGALENARAYSQIARLNKRLYALDKLKDEFIESVGHELRTPLTSLSLATQMIEANPTLTQGMIGILHNNVDRLRELIDRVLSFDQTNLVIGSAGAVQLSPLLDEVLEVFIPVAQVRGMRLVLDVHPQLAVWGDAVRLRRAIHEIVDNAVRYSSSGTIAVVADLRDGLAVVSIVDQGEGIPEDEQPMLFDAFFRGRQTRALAVTPGVGLGLSIARREIESQGGRVWLERTGPGGSIVCIALPHVAAEAQPEAERERVIGA